MAETKPISVSNINIRQSLSFLVLRLVTVEVVTLLLALFLSIPISYFDLYLSPFSEYITSHTILHIILAIGKIVFTCYIIVEWLDDYYEITPTKIIHKTGALFKKKQEYLYTHIKSVDLDQNFWGKLLNYGTIHLYDRFLMKNIFLSYIHNPKRYFHILQNLVPDIDKEENIVSGHIIDNNDRE